MPLVLSRCIAISVKLMRLWTSLTLLTREGKNNKTLLFERSTLTNISVSGSYLNICCWGESNMVKLEALSCLKKWYSNIEYWDEWRWGMSLFLILIGTQDTCPSLLYRINLYDPFMFLVKRCVVMRFAKLKGSAEILRHNEINLI